jgi:hypothetical protein
MARAISEKRGSTSGRARALALVLIGALLNSSCAGCFGRAPSSDTSATGVIRELESITDPKTRELVAVYTFNTMCSLSRLSSGQSSGPVENALVPYFAALRPEVKAKIRTLGGTLQGIPATKRAQLLGKLANHDPGSCGAAPDWEAIKHDVILSHLPVPRLRGNFCSGNVTYPDSTPGNRAITASSKVLSAIEGPITVAPVASPVVLGVEGEHVTARHPDLAVTKTTPIGNGISPYGVETSIACSSINDPCDANQGLICGQKFGANAHCIAFPVVQKDQDLIMRGYNFWDIESARLVFTPLLAGAGTESTSVVRQVDANEPSDPTTACLVASPANPTHNRAHFNVSANEGHFYRLHLYNHNGTFRTQQDALDDADPRVIHVCYPASDGPAMLPPGTVRDCTRPVETCPQDGAPCSATWTTAPRKLNDCRHQPGQPVVCGETPEWFVNERLTERSDPFPPVMPDPVVFVIGDEPTYEFRTTLQALECKDGTDWEWFDDEPMVLVAGFASDIPPGAAQNLIDKLDEAAEAYHGEDYGSGDRRQVGKLLSTVRDLHFDSKVVYLVAIAEDDGFLEGFLAGAAVIIATAAIIYLTGGVALLAAAGGAAAGLVIWTPIMAAIGGDDLIGRTTLLVTPIAIDERIGATHAADFLSAGTPLRALPKLDGAPIEHERADPRLIHPFVDFKLGPPLPAECNPGTCTGGKTCLVNRCVDPGFVDPTAGIGFRERREYVGAGGYYAVDLLWEKRQVP